ncbi:hypothetical protein L1987_09289 [Smallanthus sonchifolius]|uniref:Uncharacterized protein n=1 Tax=Smallanthus sonchifolius TaxID=185202 RepID=A0ACB9JNJ0_9ASTR|nr:hypothetical protein L1987_09289 [Smallanthus sonchifolius]
MPEAQFHQDEPLFETASEGSRSEEEGDYSSETDSEDPDEHRILYYTGLAPGKKRKLGITIGSHTQPSSPLVTQLLPPRQSTEQPETPSPQLRLKTLSLEVHTLKNQIAEKDKEIDSMKTKIG